MRVFVSKQWTFLYIVGMSFLVLSVLQDELVMCHKVCKLIIVLRSVASYVVDQVKH